MYSIIIGNTVEYMTGDEILAYMNECGKRGWHVELSSIADFMVCFW